MGYIIVSMRPHDEIENVLDSSVLPYNPDIPLICMDETSKQLTKETRCELDAKPGKPACYDFEYERNGVRNLFMFYEPFGGWRHVSVTARRTKIDWAHEIKDLLCEHYPHARKIILVMDNLNTHTGTSLYEAFPPNEARSLYERLEIHYTPKHGSWLNIAEIELRVLIGQCLARRIPDADTLKREVSRWKSERNTVGARVDWQFTTKDAMIKLKRL